METLDRDDRKWRWVKQNRRKWAKALMRPQTWKVIVTVGIGMTRVIWVVYKIIHFMRE